MNHVKNSHETFEEKIHVEISESHMEKEKHKR